MRTDAFRDLLLEARAARALAIQKRKDLSEVLLDGLQRSIPAGTIIHRGRADQPECVRTLSTIGGSDRGTSIFRVHSIISVDADVECPGLSRWTCDAIPISEKTGKEFDRSPRARLGARTSVRMEGYLLDGFQAASFEEQMDRIAKMLILA